LGRYGLQIVVLDEGQTLADSPAMARDSVGDLENWKGKAQAALLSSRGQDRFQRAEALQKCLEQQNNPVRAATHEAPVNLMELAEKRRVPPSQRQQWVELLETMNRDWCTLRDGVFETRDGVFLLPPVPTGVGWIGDQMYQAAVSTTAEYVAGKLGLNQGHEQRVILHSRFLGGDAPEIGQDRVAVHEVGHALDYALQGLPDATGFGSRHSQHVLACFEQAQHFVSDRADDDVREYFAEAVEAYLTPPSIGFDFRPDSHQAELRRRDPRMAAYLDRLFLTVPDVDWVSQPPPAQRLPDGFPDPDRDPIYLD
jgi:hypothetical protein